MGIRDIDPMGATPGPALDTLMELVPRLVSDDPVTVGVYLRERYGHCVRIPPVHPALDEEVYLLSHPDDLQHVLRSHPSDFRGLDVPGAQDFGRVVQNSVVSLHEEDAADEETGSWTRRTRMLSPEFAEAAVAGQVPRLVETTLATLAEFEGDDGGVTAGDPSTVPASARVDAPTVDGVHLLPAMRRLTLRLVGVSLFGPDVRAHEVEIIEAVETLRDLFKRRQLHLVTSQVTQHLPEKLRLPSWLQGPLGADPSVELTGRQERRIVEAVGQLTGAAEAIVERRRRTPRAFDDALGTWLWRPDPVDDEALDPGVLRQEVMGLLIAGHATVTAGLTWAFYLLAARPDVQERIHEEARATAMLAPLSVARSDTDPERTARARGEVAIDGGAFLDALPYTRRVWQETIRLYPPLPVFGRTVDSETTVADRPFTPGTHVLMSPYVTHRDPAFWDDPETFDPSRFAGESDRPELAYFPFSAGRHACLGEAIATTEAMTVLASVLSTHRVEFARPHGTPAEGFDPHEAPAVGVDSAINLEPDTDIQVRFVPRE